MLKTFAPPFAVAVAVHAVVMGLSAQAALAQGPEVEDHKNDGMRAYLAASEEQTVAREQNLSGGGGTLNSKKVDNKRGNGEAAGGGKAKGEEGKMGAESSRSEAKGRYGVERSGGAVHGISRAEALSDARDFGMVGLLEAGGFRAPTTTFGKDTASLQDAISAHGNMWGTNIAETHGSGGIGLSGTGIGGGGMLEGLGVSEADLFSHGGGARGRGTGGAGSPQNSPFLTCFVMPGRVDTSLSSSEPEFESIVRIGGVNLRMVRASEQKDPDAAASEFASYKERVFRTVRGNLNDLYTCQYQAAKKGVTGALTVQLLIGFDGRLLSVSNGGTTVEDKAVVECTLRSLGRLHFAPLPNGGSAVATVPIKFELTAKKVGRTSL